MTWGQRVCGKQRSLRQQPLTVPLYPSSTAHGRAMPSVRSARPRPSVSPHRDPGRCFRGRDSGATSNQVHGLRACRASWTGRPPPGLGLCIRAGGPRWERDALCAGSEGHSLLNPPPPPPLLSGPFYLQDQRLGTERHTGHIPVPWRGPSHDPGRLARWRVFLCSVYGGGEGELPRKQPARTAKIKLLAPFRRVTFLHLHILLWKATCSPLARVNEASCPAGTVGALWKVHTKHSRGRARGTLCAVGLAWPPWP